MTKRRLTGRCNCGAIRFEALCGDGAPAACHCRECRRGSGHYWAAISVAEADFSVLSGDTLRWWRASEKAERGFCAVCGGFLFWRQTDGGGVDIALGALDAPTGARLAAHIFTGEKGDYYDLDALPAFPQGRDGVD